MFKHEWLYTVGLMKDSYRRIMCEVVAIDANEYPSQYIREQFEPKKVNREIRKAFAGFYTELDEKGPVVTGNWGCGAFHGHLQLKCIIQWIAASLAGRDVLYSTFSKEATISYFCDLVRKCRSKGILVGQIYKWLTNYDYSPNNSLFGYLEMRLDRQE